MSILSTIAALMGCVTFLFLGIATCVAVSTRIEGVNEPGRMDR